MITSNTTEGRWPLRKPKLYRSYQWMHRKYVVQGKTEQEIAKLAGTTQATVNNWLVRHNLKSDR